MPMTNIQTFLTENRENLLSVDFKDKSKKETEQDQLIALMENVPLTVWEALGFQQIKEVTVNDYLPLNRNVGLEIVIRMEDKTQRIAPVSVRNPYWALAEIYKPYHDYCVSKIRETLEYLESHTAYVETEALSRNAADQLRRILARDCGVDRYSYYFESWKLSEPLIEYCVQNRITEPCEVRRKKKELVFSIFCAKQEQPEKAENFVVEEWAELRRYYTASVEKESKAGFAEFVNGYLLNNETIAELWKAVESDVEYLKERKSDKEWHVACLVSEELLYRELCQKALGKETSVLYMEGLMRGSLYCTLKMMMNPGITPEITHCLGKWSNLPEAYVDYLLANRERYANEMAVPAEDVEVEVTEQGRSVMAELPQYRLKEWADTREHAVERVRSMFEKEKSSLILWRINEEYPWENENT